MSANKVAWLLIPFGVFLFLILNRGETKPTTPSSDKEEVIAKEVKPESGRTFPEQSTESYCLECIEGHTMMASTEMRHALDRYRTAKKMTPGVTEKVRVAIAELQGIVEDARSTKEVSPEIKQGINEILDEVRWIRKEYGLAEKGLTVGRGSGKDLQELKSRIGKIQEKAYGLVEECPTCQVR